MAHKVLHPVNRNATATVAMANRNARKRMSDSFQGQ